MERSQKKFLLEGIPDWALLYLAVTAILSSVYFLILRDANGPTQPSIGTISTSQIVQQRHSRATEWKNVSGDQPLYLKDFVYTPAGSTVAVELDTREKVTLESNTLVQFDEIEKGQAVINLFSGKVEGALAIRQYDFRLLPFPPENLGHLADPGSIESRHAEFTAKLRAVLKRPVLSRDLSLIDIPSVTLDRFSDYEPAPKSPNNRVFNLTQNRWIRFVWAPIPFPNVEYLFEISKTVDFKKVISQQTTDFFVSLQFENENRYYWRVTAIRFGEKVVSSRVASFEVSERRGERSAMRLKLARQSKSYQVDIGTDATLRKILKTLRVREGACPKSGLPSGYYYCRVRSKEGTIIRIYPFSVSGRGDE